MPNIKTFVIRLKPGADLKLSILSFIGENKINAAWIGTCVGSLVKYNIRFANQSTGHMGEAFFEIISLTGTLSVNGSHIHICVSDSTGKTIGGHLLEGCIIYTTAEIVIQSTDKFLFKRVLDRDTGWNELQIRNRSGLED